MFKNIFFILSGAILLIIDQVGKSFLIHALKPSETIPVIKNIFHITLVLNTGCAFGLLKGQPTLFFLAVSFLAVILLICFFKRLWQKNAFSRLAAILLVSGALSNLLDRVRYGYVIDFLDFRVWPVFNLGDTAITVGVMLFILQLLIK